MFKQRELHSVGNIEEIKARKTVGAYYCSWLDERGAKWTSALPGKCEPGWYIGSFHIPFRGKNTEQIGFVKRRFFREITNEKG